MTTTIVPTDPRELRAAFACVPQGITAVCGLDAAGPAGMVVSSFTPVSLDPPLVSVCIAHSSTTWPRLQRLPDLGISILSVDQRNDCRTLSGSGDRFDGVEWRRAGRSAVVLDRAVLALHGPVTATHVAGDHTIVVIGIDHLHADTARQPLVFHASTYRRLDTTPAA